jgi:hypothetical protein
MSSVMTCPNLKGAPEGVKCSVINGFIKNIADGDTRVCMSRHYESCPLYLSGLITLFQSAVSFEPGSDA